MDDRDLSSWKEIAAHLGVTVRTAQKWEHERALPVRHLQGSRRGRVLIAVSELDAWKRSGTDIPSLPAPRPRSHWAIPLAALILCAIVASQPRHGAPSRYRIERHALIITDDRGRELWRKPFESLELSVYTADDRIWFGDLDGNGTVTVLFLLTHDHPAVDSLIAYTSDGKERWRFTPQSTVHTGTEAFAPPFNPSHFLVAPLGRERKRRVAVTSPHHLYYTSQIALLDNNGRLLREYWHSGHLQNLLAVDLGQGWNTLTVAGINNAHKTSTLLALDPDHFAGASHEEDAKYQLQDFPPPVETARILFPRSCINEKLEPFTDVTRLWKDGNQIAVEVQHRLNPFDATLFYRLNSDLTLHDLGVGTSFERSHLALRERHSRPRLERTRNRQVAQPLLPHSPDSLANLLANGRSCPEYLFPTLFRYDTATRVDNCSNVKEQILIPGYSATGIRPKLLSSSVAFPIQPGSNSPAVPCTMMPIRPRLDRPSSLPRTSSSSSSTSSVIASANSCG